MRLTLDEYAKHFKMSKEMINSKLRAKKLNYIIENGVTYIIVTRSSLEPNKREAIHQDQKEQRIQEKELKTSPVSHPPVKPKTTVSMVISLYQKENQQLKAKIAQLEAKIDKLIDDKEQMLRDEMSRVEQVYSKKDEQLKHILELINTKLTLEKENATIHEVEAIAQTQEKKESKIIDLKDYLKNLDLDPQQRKIIKKRFLNAYGSDIRIIKQNGKIFLNLSKYDYSDLLN
ncbi:hypothetical protein [Sulfurimonas sp. C5]|uniref:hypothetical protein n=1 Tax=Sulfurimonas sp. C5 TaxID=3036947 RepID=UPI002456A799|nr:hypothetical protein [Sulfurimonas sp. C5]MDH4945176.1 hypothetical protein [Sulfurimonas sp. C5]